MAKETKHPAPEKKQFNKKKPVSTEMLLEFYDAQLRHVSDIECANKLGITPTALHYRIQHSPALQYARQLALDKRKSTATLQDYVYKRLSKDAQQVWTDINFWSDTTSAYDKIEAIMTGKSETLRQELFIHALICHSFDVSTACYVTNTSRARLVRWNNDFDFRQLILEIQDHKANYFEKALVELVGERNPTAVIFANKTINAKRGYTDKLILEHTGSIQTGIDIDKLDLPLDVKRVILNALKAAEAKQVKSDENKESAQNLLENIEA